MSSSSKGKTETHYFFTFILYIFASTNNNYNQYLNTDGLRKILLWLIYITFVCV